MPSSYTPDQRVILGALRAEKATSRQSATSLQGLISRCLAAGMHNPEALEEALSDLIDRDVVQVDESKQDLGLLWLK